MRLTPAQNAQSPWSFIDAGKNCQASGASAVNASAATIGRPLVWAIDAASMQLNTD